MHSIVTTFRGAVIKVEVANFYAATDTLIDQDAEPEALRLAFHRQCLTFSNSLDIYIKKGYKVLYLTLSNSSMKQVPSHSNLGLEPHPRWGRGTWAMNTQILECKNNHMAVNLTDKLLVDDSHSKLDKAKSCKITSH